MWDEQKSKKAASLNTWYSPALLVRGMTSPQTAIVVRFEYYSDPAAVIIQKVMQNSVHIFSYSLNFDCKIREKLVWRIEAKWMKSRNPIFPRSNGAYRKSNLSAATALCFALE